MSWLVTKYLLTATLVVIISELAKRSDRLGALLTALPLVTILTLVWLHLENQPLAKIASYASLTFWYVLATLPMFAVFPVLLPRFGFWPSLLGGSVLTIVCFALLALVLRRYHVELL